MGKCWDMLNTSACTPGLCELPSVGSFSKAPSPEDQKVTVLNTQRSPNRTAELRRINYLHIHCECFILANMLAKNKAVWPRFSAEQGEKTANFPKKQQTTKLKTLMAVTSLTRSFDTADRESVSLGPVDSQIDR